MIVIKEIEKNLFDNFVKNYQNQHFMHTSAASERRSNEGWKTKYLGFYEDNSLVAAMPLLVINTFLYKKSFEGTMSPLLDWSNLNLVKDVLLALKAYLDKNHAFECEISPNLAIAIHYPEKQTLVNKAEIIKLFEECGFMYQIDSDQSPAKLRWFFKKDLSQFETYQDLVETYEPETKRLIKNAKNFPLKIVELDESNLERAVSILDLTGERRDFSTRDMGYHKSLYKYLNKKHEAKYLVVELNVKAYLQALNKEVSEIKKEINADINKASKRAQNRVNQNKDQLMAREKRISQLSQINQDTVDICSGTFIGANDTMTYLFGGSKKEYMRYYGTYFLQDYTIKYAYKKGYKIYDFYGTLSKAAGYPEGEGIFNFKKGFGGKLYENLGFFVYKPKSVVNSFLEVLRKIKHAIS